MSSIKSQKTNLPPNAVVYLLVVFVSIESAISLSEACSLNSLSAKQCTKQQAVLTNRIIIIEPQQTAKHAEQSLSRSLVTNGASLQVVEQPDFQEPIGNHTVAMGRDAQLSCKINNLGNFKTAWLRVEDKGILTIHDKTITRNYRIHLKNDENDFVLTIKNVQPTDKGGYMCQINSVPMRYAIGYLDVLTPPAFNDTPPSQASQTAEQQAAGVVTINEGNTATLSCKANGHPTPLITWRREDNEQIHLDSSAAEAPTKVEGPTLVLNSVNRLSAGAYLCIASNGVPPAASKRQVLDVQYKPIIRLPETEIRAQQGQSEAQLTCFVELNPVGQYHWVKLPLDSYDNSRSSAAAVEQADDATLIEHDELNNSDKFEIVIKQMNGKEVQMLLIIRQVDKRDFGWYKCIARNSLGLQSNSIRLIESPSSSSSSSSFSLSNMFRGSGSGLTLGGSGTPASEPQNDQQDSAQVLASNGKKQNSAGAINLSRTHTRSSWTQRSSPASSGKQESPANYLLKSSSSAADSSSPFQMLSLLFRQNSSSSLPNLLLLSLKCFLLLTAQSVVVVVVFLPTNHHHLSV